MGYEGIFYEVTLFVVTSCLLKEEQHDYLCVYMDMYSYERVCTIGQCDYSQTVSAHLEKRYLKKKL